MPGEGSIAWGNTAGPESSSTLKMQQRRVRNNTSEEYQGWIRYQTPEQGLLGGSGVCVIHKTRLGKHILIQTGTYVKFSNSPRNRLQCWHSNDVGLSGITAD